MLESAFKTRFKKKIEEILKPCFLINMNGSELQGVMDLLILKNDRWAMLEFKRSLNSTHRPNQDYYVKFFNKMGFASFVNPENSNDVLKDLIDYFNN